MTLERGDVVAWAEGNGSTLIQGPLKEQGYTDYVGIVETLHDDGRVTVLFDPTVLPYTLDVSPEELTLRRKADDWSKRYIS